MSVLGCNNSTVWADCPSGKENVMENNVFYKQRISSRSTSVSEKESIWTKLKWKLKAMKIAENTCSGEELVELINLSPKGPIYYYCKDQIHGEGGFGKVLKGFAVRGNKTTPDEDLCDIPNEVFILQNLPKHPAAIRLLHYQKLSPTTYAIVMDRPDNSKNLYNLRGERGFPFSEKRARKIIRDLGSLLNKMEEQNIVHRDIKPDNVVYDLDRHVVKLVDFGLACYFEKGRPFHKFRGTESYMPPEFLVSGTYQADKQTVWTLGILTYYLLTGCRPYKDAKEAVAEPHRPPTHLKDFSADSKDLVEGMLSIDPNRRLSLRQVIQHPWVTGRRVLSISKFIPFKISPDMKLHRPPPRAE